MSKFYIVATPIGNLNDITLRALEVFKYVDIILCEDTRVTQKLLNRYKISKPLVNYHQHSNKLVSEKVIRLLNNGKSLALVSDAGTPGIQDPGNKLIGELLEKKITDLKIIPVPGASAVTTLLSVSGMVTDSFLFMGFIPKKKGKQKMLREISANERTSVFYESGHRIMKTLGELDDHIDTRKIVVGRELTKKFETIYRGLVSEVIQKLEKSSQKGEFVVIIEGK